MPITEGRQFSPTNHIVSPGVFSREIDQSGIAQGIADIGAVIVAPFSRGPGFSPTVCNSISDLQNKFGVPDGTLYGPYTATQYLQEKGFVTVCRVGALTGYHQKYPWVIWAEEGTWTRALDSGSLNITTSFVSPSNLTFVTTSFNNLPGGSGSYTGSVSFNNQPATLTFVSGTNGPVLYNGQSINGYINGLFLYTGSLSIATSSATPTALFNQIISQNLFTGSILNAKFTGSNDPFTTGMTVQLSMFYISQSYGTCNALTLNLSGSLTGSIGNYTAFSGGTGVYDPCTKTWSSSTPSYKVLAVLADTMLREINTSLEAPGFLGSTQSQSPSPVGSSSVSLEYDLQLSQSNDGGYGTYHFSLNPNNIKYITNVFGNNPRVGNPDNYTQGTKVEASYLYKLFEDDISVVANSPTKWKINGTAMPSGSWNGEVINFTDQFSLNLLNGDSAYGLTNAYTPWVISQKISAWNGGTSTRFPLFQLFTQADGTYTNTSYKIEISNVKLAGTVAGSDWGTFTLSVRDYSDTDKKVKILEQFNNLTLDPTSPNFIARRIGDRYNYIRYDGKIIEFGTYDNLSKYVFVAMNPNPYPTTAVPYGFQAYATPINGALGYWCNPMAYTKASVYGIFPGKYPSGIDFGGYPAGADTELIGLYPSSSVGGEHWRDNEQYFAPVPAEATTGQNTVFALDDVTTTDGVSNGTNAALLGTNAIPSTYTNATNETVYVKMRKFIFGFQGGFDGQSPAIDENLGGNIVAGNTQGLNCSNSTSAGSIAYKQCIAALGNADEFDINLIVTPGIIHALHSYVTTMVVEMCETRGDCFYIMDLYEDGGNPSTGQVDEVVNLAMDFDTSYAGTYYPWVKIKDTNINQIVTVPPSVVLPAVYAANDRVAGEWWAIAGLNRGGITGAVQVTDRTTHTERDTLYEGRVNPICAFPGQGIVVWGQKTLQVADSALNRINVRRLLIEIKKFFASTARYIVFEQNTAATRNKFLAIVNPYLESIQQRSGLYAFQIKMDDSNNTPDLIDQNILYGQIWLKPTRTSEFIMLDFNILASGANFPNA